MARNLPIISVIVPTHNRQASVRRLLDALAVQTVPLEQVEVLVVADGCRDGTRELIAGYQAPFPLRVLEQPGLGAAAARNLGAEGASAPLLLFLDDDVEPLPSLVEAHLSAHQRRLAEVIIGPYPPVLHGPADFFRIANRTWWVDLFHAMSLPGHRFTYADLVGGNFSIAAALFAGAGGFDAGFRGCGREDYELGMRLLKAGASFAFVPKALAGHHDHETTDLDRRFRRARLEGRNDVLLARRHPDLRGGLGLASYDHPFSKLCRRLRRLAFLRPGVGDAVAAVWRLALGVAEWGRMRMRWRRLFAELHDYWYWRGVAEELGSVQALRDFLAASHGAEDNSEIVIDLREGLASAERRLDEERPAGVRLCYGSRPIGRIPPQPGAERLRGRHLRSLLATNSTWLKNLQFGLFIDVFSGETAPKGSRDKRGPQRNVA